jgi:hypothetical protein
VTAKDCKITTIKPIMEIDARERESFVDVACYVMNIAPIKGD